MLLETCGVAVSTPGPLVQVAVAQFAVIVLVALHVTGDVVFQPVNTLPDFVILLALLLPLAQAGNVNVEP